MTREKEAKLQEAAEKQQESKQHKQKKNSGFVGFKEGDFKDTSKDTVWRRQDNIGGAVAKQLRSKNKKFGSWAVLRKPEVHWMDVKRHKRQGPHLGVGFFAQLDQTDLYYGIHIRRSTADGSDEVEGWNPFTIWLTAKENENWLRQIVLSHDLIVSDASKRGFSHDITVSGETWELKDGDARKEIQSLSSFFEALTDKRQIDLRIQKRIHKEEALSKGENIVEEVATLFNRLMPLYEMTSVPVDAK